MVLNKRTYMHQYLTKSKATGFQTVHGSDVMSVCQLLATPRGSDLSPIKLRFNSFNVNFFQQYFEMSNSYIFIPNLTELSGFYYQNQFKAPLFV